MIQFDEHIFQLGWSNHQLDNDQCIFYVDIWSVYVCVTLQLFGNMSFNAELHSFCWFVRTNKRHKNIAFHTPIVRELHQMSITKTQQ